jgi:hypothetical protein
MSKIFLVVDSFGTSAWVKLLSLAVILFTATISLADRVDRKSLDGSYVCSNGGTLTLVPTRISNIKSLIFSKPGSLNQNAYVHFWSQMAQFKGYLYVSITIPERGQGDTSINRRPYAEMQVVNGGRGNVITITPIAWEKSVLARNGFSCRNY